MRDILHRIPGIFYGLAIIFFAWSVGNSFWELSLTYNYGDDDDPMLTLSKSKYLYQAALESAYLVGNGVMFQLLLMIANGREKKA